MADIKLFSLSGGVTELPASSVALEKELQNVIENNMQTFFGVTFLKSEYPVKNGRIDSLGLDENYCPVIFEYKRSTDENVINQGLFYLSWLSDHRADFKLLVMEKLGSIIAAKIDWSIPCVMCVASNFTKFDEHAVSEMQRNIKLIRYKKFGSELILFEQLNAPKVKPISDSIRTTAVARSDDNRTFASLLAKADEQLKTLYYSLRDYTLSLGDDVIENELKWYTAYRKIKNFACVEVYPTKRQIVVSLAVKADNVAYDGKTIRDVSKIAHACTGDVQAIINNADDLEKVKPLIKRAYDEG